MPPETGGTVDRMTDDWQNRIDAVWDATDDLGDDEVIRRIDALAPSAPDEALALFERAGARDSAGLEADAESLYREALAAGLPEWEEGRATIQLASTIRNLDRPEESVRMLREYFADRPEHPLAPAAAAFLGLALASAGRPVEGLAETLRGIAPTLPRYQRSVRAYADELEERAGGD